MAVQVTRSGVALTVGIILLTAAIIGGLLWVKHSGEQARRDEAIKIAEENLEAESNKDIALNEGDESNSDAKSGSNSSSSSTDGSGSNDSTTGELPQTGIADTYGSLLVIAALVYSGAAYLQSRRQLVK